MKLCPACQRCYDDTDAVCVDDSTALVPSRHGSRIIADKYQLERLLGRGGMGAVYEGKHMELDRPVAIKLLLPDFTADLEALERFRREARAAARLNHPNVADTYDYGSLPEGGAYIVMELIAGETLRARMDAVGQMPFNEAVQIARQVTSGVEAAHRHGITHRDLKPSNIILTRDHDNHILAKVVDFSVAKLKEGTTSGAALTATGSLIGTPRYMAPEQCADNRADARSDIYSMGVILYEMLAGRAPFEGPTTTAIAIKHIQEAPPPVEKFRPDTPAILRDLIEQALAKAPSERPQTAQEFALRLDEAARELPPSVFDAEPLTASDASQAERRDVKTNPSKSENDSATGRTGEPTREESLEASEEKVSDPPSVQSYAVMLGEPDEELETKVSAKEAVAEMKEQEEAEARALATRKAAAEAASIAPTETAIAAAATESSFPLLSEHSKTATAAHTDSQPIASHGTAVASGRNNFLPYIIAAAIVLAVGLGIYALAFRGRSARAVNENQTAQAGNGNLNGGEKSSAEKGNSGVANNAGSGATGNQSALSDSNVSAPATTPRDARAELQSLRDQWVNATVSRDINKLISFYPPVMETFYLKHNVSRNAVRNEKQRMIEQASSIELQTSEPQIALSSDGRTATMTFRKRWNFRGSQNSSGEVLQELRWVSTGDGWKITGERDLGVIR